VKYPCQDEDCICTDQLPFLTQDDHDSFFNTGSHSAANSDAATDGDTNTTGDSESNTTPGVVFYICKRKRCTCPNLGPTTSKKRHDAWVKTRQYVCWNEARLCLMEDCFVDEKDHDERMWRRMKGLPENDEEYEGEDDSGGNTTLAPPEKKMYDFELDDI